MGGNAAPSTTTENADVSTKPRHRRRDGYFWQLLIVRIPMAFFAIGLIAYLVHYVHKWQGAVRPTDESFSTGGAPKDALGQCGLAFGMASLSVAVTLWEILVRLVPHHKYGPLSLDFMIVFLDLAVIGLGIPGYLNFLFADYYASGYPTPWREDQDRAGAMVVVFWVMHCVLSIAACAACCGCCGCGPKPPMPKRGQLEPAIAPGQPAQGQDLEQAGATEPLPNYKQSTGLEEIEPAANADEPPSYPEAVRLKDLSRPE